MAGPPPQQLKIQSTKKISTTTATAVVKQDKQELHAESTTRTLTLMGPSGATPSRCPQAAQKAAPAGHSLPQASHVATVAPSLQATCQSFSIGRQGDGRARRRAPPPIAAARPAPAAAGTC